jgi:hypothetical protein
MLARTNHDSKLSVHQQTENDLIRNIHITLHSKHCQTNETFWYALFDIKHM